MKSIINYSSKNLVSYKKSLSFFLGLSNLFSENQTPFIHYRITENLFCEAFKAKNVSRKDYVVDAVLNNYGVAIKTFIQDKNSSSFQKISEFNRQLPLYKDFDGIELARKISELRNIRIDFVKRELGVEKLVFHLITRKPEEAQLHEELIGPISIKDISITYQDNLSVTFSDGANNYKFNKSKSTLYKQFNLANVFDIIPVEILENPIDSVAEFVKFIDKKNAKNQESNLEIPLYSYNNGIPYIFEKSGLNQWNASGRKRDVNEVYIPFPASLRKNNPNFFPSKDTKWDLELPNGKILKMKVCQEDGKALMSDPNKELGKWLLRDLLKLNEGEILKYETLLKIGISTLKFTKLNNLYKLYLE